MGVIEGLGIGVMVLSLKAFPTLIACLTFHGTFYVYAIIALIFTIWAIVTVKPTDGLSLVETERLYDSKRARRYEATKECSEAASK